MPDRNRYLLMRGSTASIENVGHGLDRSLRPWIVKNPSQIGPSVFLFNNRSLGDELSDRMMISGIVLTGGSGVVAGVGARFAVDGL